MSKPEDEIKIYDQLCQSYRAIDDFRSKLLGALPIVTGVGIFSMSKQLETATTVRWEVKQIYAAVGVFGALVTAGLFAYEIYGINKCGALIRAGREIEHPHHGQFKTRPQSTAGVINEPFASGVIYPAVLAAWTYFALAFWRPVANPIVPLVVFLVGFMGTLAYDRHLRSIYGPTNQTCECKGDQPGM
jgi:hypothetical protein